MKLRYVGVPVVCASLLLIAASDLPLRTIKCCSVVFGVTLKLLVVNTSWIPVTFMSEVKTEYRNL